MSKTNVKKRINIITTKIVRESSILYENRTINSPDTAADLLKGFLQDEDRENFIIVCLNTKNAPTSLCTISVGSMNASIVHPREVFRPAIATNASGIILSHNHPSGNPEPSSEDMETTKRLVEAGNILGIKVLDHIIIGFNNWISLKERGLI